MKRQIWGLEEAGIIPDKERGKSTVGVTGEEASKGETATVDKSMGKLDVGWLNSRSGKVERDMEAGLWGKARAFLEGLENDKAQGNQQHHDGDISMGT